MRGDIEPTFERDTIDVRYTIIDPALDDADVVRIFHIAYLDVLTSHDWSNKTGRTSRSKPR